MEEKKTILSHRIIIENRQTGMVTGVRDVYSFHEGEMLHVKRLNLEKGEADIEGKISSFSYLSKNTDKKEESLLKRMFR